MSRTRYNVGDLDSPYFLTCVIVDWLPVLAKPEPKEIVLNSLRYLQDDGGLDLFAYVLMENHLHLVAQSSCLSVEVARFKSYTARCIIDALIAEHNRHYLTRLKAAKLNHHTDSSYQLWQEGSHPQLVNGKKMMHQKIEYIHNNPVRRGYVDTAVDWRYSSARNYAGMESLLEVCTDW